MGILGYSNNLGMWVTGGIGSLVSFFTGYTDEAVQMLLLLMIIDVTSGLLKGIKEKRLKSAIMHIGILKKAGIVLGIVFATIADILLNDGLPVFRTLFVWLSIANEGLSIIENLTAVGVKMPTQIKDRLAQVANETRDLQKEKDGLG